MIPDHCLLICKKRLAMRIEKTYQGMSETREKTKPIDPAVDGTIISNPAIRPMIAVVFLKIKLFSITQAIKTSVMPFRI